MYIIRIYSRYTMIYALLFAFANMRRRCVYTYTSSNYHYIHTHIFSSERIFHRSSPADWPFGSTVIIERTMNDSACCTTTMTTTANPRATPCEPHCFILTYTYSIYIFTPSLPLQRDPIVRLAPQFLYISLFYIIL